MFPRLAGGAPAGAAAGAARAASAPLDAPCSPVLTVPSDEVDADVDVDGADAVDGGDRPAPSFPAIPSFVDGKPFWPPLPPASPWIFGPAGARASPPLDAWPRGGEEEAVGRLPGKSSGTTGAPPPRDVEIVSSCLAIRVPACATVSAVDAADAVIAAGLLFSAVPSSTTGPPDSGLLLSSFREGLLAITA